MSLTTHCQARFTRTNQTSSHRIICGGALSAILSAPSSGNAGLVDTFASLRFCSHHAVAEEAIPGVSLLRMIELIATALSTASLFLLSHREQAPRRMLPP
jgi:hypothetical protein